MATLWQRLKNSSGGWQSFTFVSNIFSSKKYKDLDNDIGGDENPGSEDVDRESSGNSSESLDQLDVGISRRRKYKILQLGDTEQKAPVTQDPDSLDDVLWSENNRNELIETKVTRDRVKRRELRNIEVSQLHSNPEGSDFPLNDREQVMHTALTEQVMHTALTEQDVHTPQTTQDVHTGQAELTHAEIVQNVLNHPNQREVNLPESSSSDQNGNSSRNNESHQTESPSLGSATLTVSTMENVEFYKSDTYRRPRRNSYEKALAEMRDSHDRVFADVIMHSSDKPAVVVVNDLTSPVRATTERNTEGQYVTFRRQLSSVIPGNIPGPINGFRQRSYSKLSDHSDEIVDIPLSDESKSGEWHESFPAPQKKKRKRPKKAWKKTKKAFRVTMKWIRRSFIAFGSNYNYGIPINVAMYGGSRRDGRPKFYDYR